MTVAEPNIGAPAPEDKTRRTVLQVLPHLDAGGTVRGTIEIARALNARGWRALVASEGGAHEDTLRQVHAECITLPLATKNPYHMWRNAARLARLIDDRGIDLIHARSRAPAWSGLLAAHRRGIPFVTTFHGTYGHRGAAKRRYNSVMTRGDRVIAISEHIAGHMASVYGADPARVRVIHRGVDADRFDLATLDPERVRALVDRWALGEDSQVVLLPGRLTQWKGQKVMVEAMARLGRDDAVCVLAGDDQGRERYRDRLQRQIRRAGLEGRVRIVGDCADMAAAYALASVVVSASTDPEAFGRVIVEAQAMGRPVIASDHGGARETVVDGDTGLLVPPGDAAALARALDQLLSQPAEQRRRRGAAAAAHARANFTTPRMCAQTLAVYDELLGGDDG